MQLRYLVSLAERKREPLLEQLTRSLAMLRSKVVIELAGSILVNVEISTVKELRQHQWL